MTEFPLSTPEPILIGKIIDDSISNLQKAGLKLNKETPFFFIGHSLGGIMMQDYLLTKINSKSSPVKIAGLILEGSYIERKHYEDVRNPLTPPILALGGSLDGVNRIARMAESRFFDLKNKDTLSLYKRLTLIVDGMNHYQFAGEGNPPLMVRSNDLKAEVSDESARDQITSIVSSFMRINLNAGDDEDKSLLDKYSKSTARLLDPILDALQMEGSYYLNPPCYKNQTAGCTLGSRWTEIFSQPIMGSTNASVIDLDVFHDVYQTNPVHLPQIFNSCANQPSSCLLNVTTVTQLEYPTGSSFDISLQPVAASEMKTKLASRQAILHAYTGKSYDLKVTDAGNICADINTASIHWAMENAPSDVLQRYLSTGRQLTVGDDIGPLNVGPLWIWTSMQYNNKVDPNTKKPICEIRSPMMKTPIDYPIPLARGFHYCKVLSPARAMEWIYTDSLKP